MTLGRAIWIIFVLIGIDASRDVKQCRETLKGREYKGTADRTRGGYACQRWDTDHPHRHSFQDEPTAFPDASVSDADNYCRNPDASELPWCYTRNPHVRWQFCDVPLCDANALIGCSIANLGTDYTGTLARTVSGRECQRWDSQFPHSHNYNMSEFFPDDTLEDAADNCRNPVAPNPTGMWCFTTDPEMRWELCEDPPVCPEHPECRRTERGMEYRGNVKTTRTGRNCSDWPESSPELKEAFCRNPDNKPEGPWCWVDQDSGDWEYCDIAFCKPSAPCKTSSLGTEYVGTVSLSRSGRPCQRWNSNFPHRHRYHNPADFYAAAMEEPANHCRNPDQDPGGPWCYTLDPQQRWEHCDVPLCDCLVTQEGREYAGTAATTESGKECQSWNAQTPHAHNYTDANRFPDASIDGAGNYCRNPDERDRPWCLTTEPDTRWEYCDIPVCDKDCGGHRIPRRGVKHVIQLGLDGLHPCFTQANATNIMDRLGAQGTSTLNKGRTVLITVSSPSWTASVTGMDVESTGVTANSWRPSWKGYAPGDITPVVGSDVHLPTVFDTLKRRDKNIRTAAFTDWDWWHFLTSSGIPGSLDKDYFCDPGSSGGGLQCDRYSTGNATEYLRDALVAAEMSYTFLYFENIDSTGHGQGWCSEPYLDVIKATDDLVGDVLDVVDELNMAENVLVMLSTDHGGHDFSHGSWQDSDLQIPLFVRGPGVKKNHQFEHEVKNSDIVPTSVFAMGYEPSPKWTGSVMHEAFEDN